MFGVRRVTAIIGVFLYVAIALPVVLYLGWLGEFLLAQGLAAGMVLVGCMMSGA